MGEGAGVERHAVHALGPGLFQAIDERALVVGLEKFQSYVVRRRAQEFPHQPWHGVQTLAAVYLRLTAAESPQIGAVEHKNAVGHGGPCRRAFKAGRYGREAVRVAFWAGRGYLCGTPLKTSNFVDTAPSCQPCEDS